MLQQASNLNAGALITIPMNGYLSADESGPVDLSDPNRFNTRFIQEAPAKGSAFTTDPAALRAQTKVYEDEFVNWIKTNFAYSLTDPNRPISFDLDNEPDLWSSTHQEVHPNAVTYQELINDSIAYATAIKAVESSAWFMAA